MTDTITIEYTVEDGYAGGHRPHSVIIPLVDFVDCETPKDVDDLIEQAVQDDFVFNVYPSWDRDQSEGILDLVKQLPNE